ncbi:TonB-dependent vitamin B12 receptor [Uliginosibacterium gangwonense]|uniref:TonB-dependent vitamin B12 receptor n=1 Tax=Uliginosibacterium gangwonense TaxID=392736 RepID=UPI00036C303A|nr:TonB-dependent vitamin B12 receptor [Uliginosibacterium gangwonense]
MFQYNYKPLSAAILLSLSSSAFALESELEPVVITANRIARTASETLASVDVMTRADIEQSQAQSVQDLLRGMPGVQFSNNGGTGKATSLFLRGSNSGHTLILVDGVKIGSATLGTAPLEDIPLDTVERIEIVRGPRASLYGSEAIGGVIQIFTKRGVQAPSASFGAGSHETYDATASGGFGTANGWVNANASRFSTRGFNVKDGSTESDRDGYSRNTGGVRAGARLGETLSLDAQAQHTEGRNLYDGNPNMTVFKQELYAGNLRYAPTDNYATSLKLAQNLDATNNYKDEVFSSRIDTRRTQANWQHEITLTKGHQLVGGLDWQYDKVISDTAYEHDSRTNKAAFAQYLADIGAFNLQLAGRHDRNEQFGHHNTGSAALGYTVSPALHLRASYGTAFKAPTFNDLYWPDAGNPNLQPEKSRSSEIGASGKQGNFEWQASAYRTNVSNLIDWAPISPGSWTWIPSNISKAQITGLELSTAYQLKATRIALSANLTRAVDRSGGSTDGNQLALRARQTGRIDIDHKLGSWTLGGSLNGVGSRYKEVAHTTKLGGYATTDLRAEYIINTSWKLQTRIENLFDKRYQTAYGYNQAGLGAFVTVRYQAQ